MSGYRLVLRAYPKGPRREELFDTLTASGRTRPTPREAVNLLRHGMRARLGRPGSRGVVVLAVLVALSTGYLSAAVAARIGWERAPGFPSGPRLAAIQQSVFPGVAHWAERDGGPLFIDIREPTTADVLVSGHDEDFKFSTLVVGPEGRFLPGDYRAWTEGAAARLAADGWDVGETEPMGATIIATGELDQDGTLLTATRGGLVMEVETSTAVVDTPPGSFDVTATLTRTTPRWLSALSWAAWLAGAVLGWLATGWVSRRTEGAGGATRSLTREPVVVALVLTTPLTLLGTAALVADTIGLGGAGWPFWSMSMTYGWGVTQFAAVMCLLSVLVAAFAGRSARTAAQRCEAAS
ncbi:hypothetical protein AB0J80_10335 [Actinoplanes sp. NPDC049548]|uniref:hypothetical protein n=1 Tax=Actinoplanes sp. NPDC049548 TaxID=3155152 RepID=UPI00342060C6